MDPNHKNIYSVWQGVHPRWSGGVVLLAAELQHRGEDLRDDPVRIVKEGRPLPQDAMRMMMSLSRGHDLVVETPMSIAFVK